MIGQIGPLVQGGFRRSAMLHIAGGTLGGMTIGVVLGFVGTVLNHALGVSGGGAVLRYGLPVVLLVLGFADLRLLHLPPLGLRRQTPGVWSCTLGPLGASFAWGFDLGLGVTTRIPYRALLAAVMYAIASESLAAAVMLMSIYGLVRSSVVALTASAGRNRISDVCIVMSGAAIRARATVGGAGLVMGTTLLLGGRLWS
jgi:hypothetical protein